MKTLFFENVIIGRDVFLRTNPEELEIFKKFVNKMENYDIVMDGLNVAYSAGKQSSQILSALVFFGKLEKFAYNLKFLCFRLPQ